MTKEQLEEIRNRDYYGKGLSINMALVRSDIEALIARIEELEKELEVLD